MADFTDAYGRVITPGMKVVVATKIGWKIGLRKGEVYRTQISRFGNISIGIRVEDDKGRCLQKITYHTPKNICVVS